MKIGLLHSLIRKEEKLLIEAFRNAGVEPVMIDDRKLIMDFHSAPDIDILVCPRRNMVCAADREDEGRDPMGV